MGADAPAELHDLRDAIDEIDEAIADLVAERTDLAADVARVKADADRPLVDEQREDVVVSRYADAFEAAGLLPERGEDLARFLIETSLATERRVDDD